jgi:gamma-glutamyl:cysteine ligase YbdK (ATP-grasp superfamily)
MSILVAKRFSVVVVVMMSSYPHDVAGAWAPHRDTSRLRSELRHGAVERGLDRLGSGSAPLGPVGATAPAAVDRFECCA